MEKLFSIGSGIVARRTSHKETNGFFSDDTYNCEYETIGEDNFRIISLEKIEDLEEKMYERIKKWNDWFINGGS